MLSQSSVDLGKAVKNLSAGHVSSQMKLNRDTLPSCFSSPNITKCPFCSLLSVTFFAFLCFGLVILAFKVAPNHSSQNLCCVPKNKNIMPYHENESVRQTSLGHELAMRSLLRNPQYIFNKVSLKRNTHKTRLNIAWLANKL